mmetsp:Transcript_9354/g.14863  ORF Transcript_9354/g.14863 Transcript_9354/m.14863 type:complete len:209 (+) Transcript_9354:68-694(+)
MAAKILESESDEDIDDRIVRMIEDDEAMEEVGSISQNQGVLAALLLAFTYTISAESISLEGVCTEDGECDNFWGSREHSDYVMRAYQIISFMASVILILVIMYHTTLLTQFARVPKSLARRFRLELGSFLIFFLPNYLLIFAVILFLILMLLQISVTMHTVSFQSCAVAQFIAVGSIIYVICGRIVPTANKIMAELAHSYNHHGIQNK